MVLAEFKKMWNELSSTNRNGCHCGACCSLLRSNNKNYRQIRQQWSGVSGTGWQPWSILQSQSLAWFLDESLSFKYSCQSWSCGSNLLMQVYRAFLSAFAHAWSAMKTPCGFCYTSHIISWWVGDLLADLCLFLLLFFSAPKLHFFSSHQLQFNY